MGPSPMLMYSMCCCDVSTNFHSISVMQKIGSCSTPLLSSRLPEFLQHQRLIVCIRRCLPIWSTCLQLLLQFSHGFNCAYISKGCFTWWPKVERRRNSNNLIGGEWKFVLWAFCRPKENAYQIIMVALFWEFWRQRFLLSTKSLGKTRIETQIVIERRNYSAKSFFFWLNIWGVWATASLLVGHHIKQP